MARRNNRTGRNDRAARKEPRFDDSSRGGLPELRFSASDRVGVITGEKSTPKGAARRGAHSTGDNGGAKRRLTRNSGNRGGARDRKRGARRFGRVRRLSRIAYWSCVLGIWAAIIAAATVAYHAAQLPQMSSWSVPERPPNVRILARDGTLIANRGATGGEAVRLGEMSPYLPKAVIAIEDRRFHDHFGIDPVGFGRAMTENLLAGAIVQGGSTITQQLAKNLFLEPDRTIGRKIQEAVLAIWLETKFSKDEILELYLNRVYFGAGAYGVDAASRRYFDKSARDVTLSEAALLAGLLKAPSRLSPLRDEQAAEERAQLVLSAMRQAGFLSDREVAQALSMQPGTARRYWSGSEHYLADMVMAKLPALLGDIDGDVTVETSVDLDLQRLAGQIIAETLKRSGAERGISQGALVALEGNGAIIALVGGREYAESQFNRAVEAMRQPGSAFKPIVYLAALEAGRTPDSVRQDAPVTIGDWTPENYDRKYRGEVTLRRAFADSLNTVAAQLVMEVGPRSVAETARRLGIRSEVQRNASIALGTSEVALLELTAAYASFSNGGYGVTPWLVRSVRGADGELLYGRETPPARLVVRQRELGMINSMMAEAIRSGTGRAAKLKGWPAAGKTGTTQNSRDALFVGYTARLTAGIWYGNDDGSAMKGVTGGTLPAQSFARFMSAAHRGLPAAVLPGSYFPEVAVLPNFRPRDISARRTDPTLAADRQVTDSYPFATPRISNTPQHDRAPRPAAEVNARPPRNASGILDLLIGD
jgi:penicillin-binding protein 1A